MFFNYKQLINTELQYVTNNIFVQTPLHLSAEHGHCRNIEILIDSGADLLVKDANGLTPLELARHTGHNDCENMLESALGKTQ